MVRDNTCLGSHKDKSVLKENDGFQQCHKEGGKWKPPHQEEGKQLKAREVMCHKKSEGKWILTLWKYFCSAHTLLFRDYKLSFAACPRDHAFLTALLFFPDTGGTSPGPEQQCQTPCPISGSEKKPKPAPAHPTASSTAPTSCASEQQVTPRGFFFNDCAQLLPEHKASLLCLFIFSFLLNAYI